MGKKNTNKPKLGWELDPLKAQDNPSAWLQTTESWAADFHCFLTQLELQACSSLQDSAGQASTTIGNPFWKQAQAGSGKCSLAPLTWELVLAPKEKGTG